MLAFLVLEDMDGGSAGYYGYKFEIDIADY